MTPARRRSTGWRSPTPDRTPGAADASEPHGYSARTERFERSSSRIQAAPARPATTPPRAETSAGARRATALPTLLTIEEVADHLGVTVRQVRRLVAERRAPFLKWGHLLRFDPADLVVWHDEGRVDAV
jgi:excisionase family DNA binding protein